MKQSLRNYLYQNKCYKTNSKNSIRIDRLHGQLRLQFSCGPLNDLLFPVSSIGKFQQTPLH